MQKNHITPSKTQKDNYNFIKHIKLINRKINHHKANDNLFNTNIQTIIPQQGILSYEARRIKRNNDYQKAKLTLKDLKKFTESLVL